MGADAEIPVISDPAKDPKGLARFTRKVAMMLNGLVRNSSIERTQVAGIKGDTFIIPGALGGTVTSVGVAVPAEFSSAGGPITGAGVITISKANQNANRVWAGPTTGAAAAPTFRALVAADIPSLPYGTGTVTSISVTVPTSILSVTPATITTSGTFAISLATQTANLVFAGPTTGAAAAPTFRALVAADLPAGAGSPLTTKGDIYVFSTVSTRLPVGSNGKALVADSTAATGVSWQTIATTNYIPLVDGSEPPGFITDGNGNLILVPIS